MFLWKDGCLGRVLLRGGRGQRPRSHFCHLAVSARLQRVGRGACPHSHKDGNGLAGSTRKPFQKATLKLLSTLRPLIFLSPPVSFDKFQSTCQTCSQQLKWGTAAQVHPVEPPILKVAMVS